MANGVYYVGLQIELNLTEPDLGHPEYPGLWEQLRSDRRPVPQRGLQCIQCRQNQPDCPEWMFLNERYGIRYSSHFTRGIKDHEEDGESDQHKAFKERISRAAESGGFAALPEDRSGDGKRRTDVLVKGAGGLAIGWEVQLSYASLESVRKRASLARKDGITPLWATVDERRDFIDRVPWALTWNLPWQEIRDSRTIGIRGGVRALDFWRCDNRRMPCPAKGSGGCGKLHGTWDPARGVHLDDLVRWSAAGEYVPIVLPGKRTRRWWVKPADRDRYADSVGGLPGEDDLNSARRTKAFLDLQPRDLDKECRYGQDTGYRAAPAQIQDDGASLISAATFDLPSAPPALRTPIKPGCCSVYLGDVRCGMAAQLYPRGWRCQDHQN